jgi:hypothetical protein
MAVRAPSQVVASVRKPEDPVGDDEDQDRRYVFESWLVDASLSARPEKRLLTRARARRSDSGGSPVTLEIHGDTLRFDLGETNVPSSFVGTFGAELGLSPPTLKAEEQRLWNRTRPCVAEDETESCKKAPVCDQYAYALLPDVSTDAAFANEGWSTAALGACAVDIDGSPGHGFVTFGKTQGRDDASFRAVLSDGALYVEVHDDKLIGPTASWVNEDHLEIWVAHEADSYMRLCPDGDIGRLSPPQQWGIGLMDGRVFAGSGKPTETLGVNRSQVDAHTVRLRITLPAAAALSVVYSDSDDGKVQKSLLSTSKLVFGDTSTLGVPKRIPKERAACRVTGGRLEPQVTPPSPAAPVYTSDD